MYTVYVCKIIPARDPKQGVCVRSLSRKSRDLDALGSREVMVVIKVGIVVTVAVVASECECECESESESECG